MTREGATNILKTLKSYYNDKSEDSYVGFDDEDNRALDMAIKALSSSENPNKWIPVWERLPDKYAHTLWCASSGYVRSDYFNGEFWEDAEKYCYEVIAWMPLPEPYKEVQE